MSKLQDELSLLREEHQVLSRQIIRFSFLRVLIVLLFVFSLADGFQKTTNDKKIKSIQVEIDSVAVEFGKSLQEEKKEEKERLRKELEELHKKIEPQLKAAFTLSLNVFGGSFEIDTRAWMYSLPFLLLFSQVYSLLLGRKQKLLSTIAAAQIEANHDTHEISIVDRLMFSRPSGTFTVYSTYPYKLVKRSLDLTLVVILLYFAASWWKTTGDLNLVRVLAQFLMLCTMYAAIIYRTLSNRLESEIVAATEIQVQNFSTAYWKRFKGWIRFDVKRSKSSLLTGSILVLLSLVLVTGNEYPIGCQGAKMRGYEVVTQIGVPHNTALQLDSNEKYESMTVELLPSWFYEAGLILDWVLYTTCIAISIVTIPLAIFRKDLPEFRKKLVPRIFIGLLTSLTGISFFFMIGFLTIAICMIALVAIFLDFSPLTLESIETSSQYLIGIFVIYGFYRLLKWFRFAFTRKELVLRQQDFYNFTINLCTPVILVGVAIVAVIAKDYPGLMTYYVGLNLLFFGYLQIAGGQTSFDGKNGHSK